MANQRLDATITIGSVLERSVGKNLNIIRRGLDGVGDEIKKVTDRQRELSKQRKVLERQGQSVDALDREYEQLGRTLDDLRRKQERFERAQGAANRVGRQFADVSSRIGRTARNAGIAVGAVGTAAFGIANSAAAAGREIRIMSQLSNAGTDEFQRFAAAGKSVGFEQDKMADILKDVNDRIGDFNETGGGPMADFFENIGPKVGITAKHFKDLSGPEALQLYVSSLKAAGLSQQEMTFYMEAMASDSTALIPLLRDNGKEMKALGDEAAAVGAILDDDAIAASERFSRQLGRSKTALTGVKNTIGLALLPVIGDMADSFTDFVVNNQPQIKEFAETFATGFRDNLPLIKDTIIGFKDFALEIGKTVGTVADFVGGWDNLAIGLAAVKFAPLITSVAGLGVTLGRLVWSVGRLAGPGGFAAVGTAIKTLGGILLGNPIGLAVAGIAAGAYLIYKNWDGVSAWFSDMWGNVRTIFGGFGDFVGGVFTGDMGRAKEGLQSAWGGTKEFFGGLLDGIGGAFTAVWTDLIKPVTDKLGLTEHIVSAWNAARDGIGNAMTWVGDKLTEVKDAYVTPFIDLMSGGLSGIAGAWQGVRDAIGGVLDWMGEKFDWILGKLQPLLDKLQWVQEKGVGVISSITDFFGFGGDEDPTERAIGGAFGASRPLLVGERGPELIYPNQGGFVAHNRALERMAAMSKMIGGGEAANDNGTPAFGRLASEIGGMGRAVAAAVGAMMLTVSAPEPAIAIPAPVVTINQPAPEQSAPAVQQVIERAAPAINFAPVFDPIIEQAAPVVQSTIERVTSVLRPVFNQAAPVIEQAATILRPPFAMPEMPAPVFNQGAPVVQPSFNVAAGPAPVVNPSFAMPEPAPLDLSGIMSAPEPRQAQGGGSRVSNVTQNITINAPQNMDVQQLVAELERLKSLAQNDALFDGANDWGQYA